MNAIVNQEELEKAVEVELPEKLHFLITESARFKVALGGRGSAKTESFARA